MSEAGIPFKREVKRAVLKKGEAKCPHCGDEVYLHFVTQDKDEQGRRIIVCIGCANEYVEA